MGRFLLTLLIALQFESVFSQSGSISNIQVSQRTDGSGLLDVSFDVIGPSSAYYISMEASFDGGNSFTPITSQYLNGDVGPISPGLNKQIIWNGMGSSPNIYSVQTKLKLIANTTPPGSITDIDGNLYQTVMIGQQLWMKENLKTTHYRNGDAIPNVTTSLSWAGDYSGAYCWYNNDITWKDVYGALYDWYAVTNTSGLCPTGWHTPSDAELSVLSDYLGGLAVSGGKMKEAGTLHWSSPNTGATNESGFTGLPGGYRNSNGSFPTDVIGKIGTLWSGSEGPGWPSAWYRQLSYDNAALIRNDPSTHFGFSVRCLKN